MKNHYFIYFIVLIVFLSANQKIAFAAEWFNVNSTEIQTIVCTGDNQFSWYNGPGEQTEWLLNFGAANRSRIKGYQDITG